MKPSSRLIDRDRAARREPRKGEPGFAPQPWDAHPALAALVEYLRVYGVVCALAERQARLEHRGGGMVSQYSRLAATDPAEIHEKMQEPSPDDCPIGSVPGVELAQPFLAMKTTMDRRLRRLERDLSDDAGAFGRRLEMYEEGKRRPKGAYSVEARRKHVVRRAVAYGWTCEEEE